MSFQQGLSGLNSTSKSLDVIGNNIANANTYGSKVARAEFADLYAASLGGNGENVIGIGTKLATVSQQFSQGGITTTSNPMDLAINGPGFFQLIDSAGAARSYSRNGQFKVDVDGYVVNNGGQRLMGIPADTTAGAEPAALTLPTGRMLPPQATGTVKVEFNLDSRNAAPTQPINFTDASTYNGATSVTVYDAQGIDSAVTVYFRKTAAPNTWEVYATQNGLSVNDPPAPLTELVFADDGSAPTAPLAPFDLPVTSAGGFARIMQLDMTQATQFGASFSISDLRQDGFTAGQLTSVSVEKNGEITARYSNGETRAAGIVMLANFRNPQGLSPAGENAWRQTPLSGDVVPGQPGDGIVGAIQAGALEESNVDLTAELVNMITTQRMYQANAQAVKTQDQILQTLVNLR
jgi:flagellar hook protein FlgE